MGLHALGFFSREWIGCVALVKHGSRGMRVGAAFTALNLYGLGTGRGQGRICKRAGQLPQPKAVHTIQHRTAVCLHTLPPLLMIKPV